MESWSYVSGGKGIVSDDSVSASHSGIAKSGKDGLMSGELKSPWSYGSPMLCSSQEGVENQEFVHLGTSDMMGKSLAIDSIGDVLACKISSGREISSLSASINAFSGEEGSSSKLSSSAVESNCRDSSLIDLKLGRVNDHRDAKNFSSFDATQNLSSTESWIPAKKARAGGLSSQTPYCQVHGCKKDLSSSKDYHKRHKVCEIHSKTPKVIVNGIEQRFCQQCSRFHLLAEFDDVKRSCRKRLAGHNERRRKPHMRIHDGRAGRLFQSFNGTTSTMFPGNAFSASSFVCQDIHPSSLLHSEKYDINDSSRIVKVEDGADVSPYLSNPFASGLGPPKSLFSSHDSGKLCPSVQNDGISSITRSKINENSSYIQDIVDSDFVSHSMFHTSSVGNEDMKVLDSSSTIQGLPGSHSGCALSLLSSQSQNSMNHSTGVPTALPLITSGSRALYAVAPEKLSGVSCQTPSNTISTAFHSSLMNSSEEKLDLVLISADSAAINSGIDGIIQGPEYMNSKNSFSPEDGPTINLLQLSSQLQRVEHQRQSMLVKQENDAFSELRIT